VPIDLSNFIFVIFVIGVGGDYSLFLLMAELEPLRGYHSRVASTGGAVTICALTTLFGVGVLALARHPALFSIGIAALLGISLSLVATLFLVPLRMDGLRRRSARSAAVAGEVGSLTTRAKRVRRLYRYQGPYVEQYVFWKMKTDPLFRAVEKAVPARAEILDVGCGYGIVAHWLTVFSPERCVRGVDFDADKVRVAQATARANQRVRFEERDILEMLEFPACDCVLLCDVLHYFPRELKANLLRKIFAALRPGGLLVIRDAMAREDAAFRAVAYSEKLGVLLRQNRTRHGLHFDDQASHLVWLREAGFTEFEVRDNSGVGSNVLMVARKAREFITSF
jgi:SAM-dependent methyltransferase